jgi:Fe2+ transport system protein FeoA
MIFVWEEARLHALEKNEGFAMPQLHELPVKTPATIAGLEFDEAHRRRFAHMGLCLGTPITVIRASIRKSPMMVRAQGAYFMIRFADATHIRVILPQ